MSCGRCGNDYLICQKGDEYVCEDCYGEMMSECEDCDYKEDCEIYEININDSQEENDNVREEIIKFFKDNEVTCPEAIHQTDRVMEKAYDLLEKLLYLVKEEVYDDEK